MALTHLLIMRHAKSSWNEDVSCDHARPLNRRGHSAAKTIGSIIRLRGFAPDMIWSSDSVRTRETVASAFPDMDKAHIKWMDSFYHAAANQVLYQCAELGEPHVRGGGKLLLMGHNPGWEDLFYHFSGQSQPMPTGACAVFPRTGDTVDWLEREAWQLQDFLRPKAFA